MSVATICELANRELRFLRAYSLRIMLMVYGSCPDEQADDQIRKLVPRSFSSSGKTTC